MPIVSINLSEAAFEVYQRMEKGSRSRRISYLLLRNSQLQYTQPDNPKDYCKRCRGIVAPQLEPGDVRIRENGDNTIWTVDGWKVV